MNEKESLGIDDAEVSFLQGCIDGTLDLINRTSFPNELRGLIDVDFPDVKLTEEELAKYGFFGKEELERQRRELEEWDKDFCRRYEAMLKRQSRSTSRLWQVYYSCRDYLSN